MLSFVESITHCEYDDALTEIFSKQGRQREYINFISDSVAIQSFNVGKASCGIDIGVRSARREFGDGVVGMIRVISPLEALIGEEATVKTFYKEKDHIRLQPENSTMDPIIVPDCKILGKVGGVFRKM